MTPTPQEYETHATAGDVSPAKDDNRVVISGMSGLYPQARYIKDLEKILYNKINPVSAESIRWKYSHPEVAQYTGNVPSLELFDAQFFKVHYRLAESMDSMSRKILEQAYEAIYDAGVNPEYLDGKKVGVYIGSCFSETEKACFYVATRRSGFGIAGCNKSMFANRISYWLNVKGPSMSIDEACCSSTAALEQAYMAIARGECEAAIVGGANLCLHPQSSIHYGRIMSISMDGKTKSFAQDAAGCARSEAINVLFLQRAKDAMRIYADVVHVKSEFISIMKGEASPRYGFFRDPKVTAKFLKAFYKEAGVPPSVVEYVEAVGSAVLEADKSELEAIDEVFCKNRKCPLLVGSVMSNIGYGEAASGISAVTKVLLGYHRGELAANLHYDAPRIDIDAVRDGRLEIVGENQPFNRTYAAVNGMSVTGVNSQVLLHGHYKPKDLSRYKSSIPHLVAVSGRQDSSVKRVFDILKSNPIDPEELALLHHVHEIKVAGHLGRGYTILDTDKDGKTISLSEEAKYFDGTQRPLWFMYSGMGSQWPGMGLQLMRIPVFSAAIERCHKVLKPKGIDLLHIITTDDKNIFDNILHSFVGIAAIQIGITDVLKEVGLVPDKIIGHSVGELGCAYADGCLTAEEMILSAYSRGLVSLETPFIRGSMAAVGMGYQQICEMCPEEIEVACHNSAQSCTISGPAGAMREFIEALTAKKIFAREVPCSNIAYHSRYIAEAGPGLLKYLKDIIQTPKARSDKWISTSVPQDRWNEPIAQYASAQYLTNNLLSPVLFEEASNLIPSNAVLLEVAPHALMQAILKRSLPPSCTYIPLTRRGHNDNVLLLLEALGKIYLEGYIPKVQALYPRVEFPVSTGTPFLSHLVDWSHQELWDLPLYQCANRTYASSCKFLVSIHDDEYSYLKGNVIRGKMLLPFSFALVAAWDTLAMFLNMPRKSIDVQFRDVEFHAQPILFNQKTVKLTVSLQRGSGYFQILSGNSKVVNGFISTKKIQVKEVPYITTTDFELNSEDIYRIFYGRDFNYSGEFRSIQSASETFTEANIVWNDNWVTFLDGMLQLYTLRHNYNYVSQPDHIREIDINVDKHIKCVQSSEGKLLRAAVTVSHDGCSCGGVTIENMQHRNLPPLKIYRNVLRSLKFVPRFQAGVNMPIALQVLLQIAAENLNKDIMNVTSLKTKKYDSEMFIEMANIADGDGVPGIKIQYNNIDLHELKQNEDSADSKKIDVVLVKNFSRNDGVRQTLFRYIQENTFIINEEDISEEAAYNHPTNLYKTVSILKNSTSQLELIRWRPTISSAATTLTFTAKSKSDLPQLLSTLNKLPVKKTVVVLTSHPPVPGLLKLVQDWRRNTSRKCVSVMMVNENSKESEGLDELPDIYLALSVFSNGLWGGEYQIPLTKTPTAEHNKVMLQSGQVGNLESLQWRQIPEECGPGVPIKVKYAGINVNDARRAQGIVTLSHKGYGMDFSGYTESGQKVMGLVRNAAASSHVMADPEFLWPVPSYWTLEDAATVPFAYAYAYYCLDLRISEKELLKIKEHRSILVHGATGALGQAMINVALARGYHVFATVSDLRKKRFLLKLFPELKKEHIGNSRDSTFADLILSATHGEGCNLVVCCLQEQLKKDSLRCCSAAGKVFDTVQIPNHANFVYGMYQMTKERSYVAVDVTNIYSDDKIKDKIHKLISEGIVRGEVRPLTRVSFPAIEAARAFRLVAASRHRGRVLLCLDQSPPPAQLEINCSPDYCHIIVTDTQPLGFQMADKLIERGVRKLHLHFNKLCSYLQHKLRSWERLNIQVTISHGDLNKTIDVHHLVKKGLRLGPVEGIYILSDLFTNTSFVEDLDEGTKKCNVDTLRYFLVTTNQNLEQDTFIRRKKAGLPSTLLNLSMLKVSQGADGCLWYEGALEAVEGALLSLEPVVYAQKQRSLHLSLIKQIAALADLNISKKTPKDAQLGDLVVGVEQAKAITAFLRDVYYVALEVDEVLSLTIEKLNDIENSMKEIKQEEVTELSAFYSYVDPDELLATTDLVLLPTLVSSGSMRDDEFDMSATYLCIVPGLEGHYARFRTLCERLHLPALVLQPGLDRPHETIQELAHRYSEILLKKINLNDEFYLLGYEAGVMVAIELAAILEERGLTGTVFCLGDGPEETKEYLEAQLKHFDSENTLQTALVQHMSALMSGEPAPVENEAVVDTKCEWTERVEVCVRALRGRVAHSAQYTRALLEAAYARIASARRYNAARRDLRSKVVLLRTRYTRSDKPCSLHAHHTHSLPTPMHALHNDHAVPALINRYLSNQLREDYLNKNICDTYIANADAFMSPVKTK